MTRDTLIYSQCHVRAPVQGRLMATSIALTERLNPQVDLLLVDNASPLDPLQFLEGRWMDGGTCFDDGPMSDLPGGRMVARFSDAIGHFHYDRHRPIAPRDGPGRAIMTALASAMNAGYRRACYIESDALFFRPAAWGFDQLSKPIGCQPRIEAYGYLDWTVWWAGDMSWLRAFDFIGKYDWPNQKADWQGGKTGEQQYEDIFADNLQIIPMRGGRGDAYGYTAEAMPRLYPDGVDYITHADRGAYVWCLEKNGHADLGPNLMG